MNAPLPAWADTPQGRSLLAAIRIERPDCWQIRRNAWGNREPRCKGANAKALRALWEAQRDAAMEANDRDTYARLTNHEHPDDLIWRTLNEEPVAERKRARAA